MNKRKNVSVRLSDTDINKVKRIADRLGVKDSELLRFAVKNMLKKASPLGDEDLNGQDLVPALLQCGEDIVRYFELDAAQLEELVNHGVTEESQRVERNDLGLISLVASETSTAAMKLKNVVGYQVDASDAHQVLENYLIDKYIEKDVQEVIYEQD